MRIKVPTFSEARDAMYSEPAAYTDLDELVNRHLSSPRALELLERIIAEAQREAFERGVIAAATIGQGYIGYDQSIGFQEEITALRSAGMPTVPQAAAAPTTYVCPVCRHVCGEFPACSNCGRIFFGFPPVPVAACPTCHVTGAISGPGTTALCLACGAVMG